MATSILNVKLDTRAAEANANRLHKSLDKLEKKGKSLSLSYRNVGKSLKSSLSASSSAGLDTLSRRSKVATNNLRSLSAQSRQTGINIRSLNSSVSMTNKNLSTISGGTRSVSLGTRAFNKETLTLLGSLGVLGGALRGIRSLMVGGIFALGATGVVSMIDGYKNVNSLLKIVTNSQEHFNRTQADLFKLSQENYASIQTTTRLYVGQAKQLEALGYTHEQQINAVDLFSKALTTSGATAGEAASATLQYIQGLSSGILRGQEFNSIMENGRGVAIALADGLDVTIGRLREMAMNGELSAKIVVDALLSQNDVIREKFKNIPVTVSRAWQLMVNSMTIALSDLNRAVGDATGNIAEKMRGLSQILDGINFKNVDFSAMLVGVDLVVVAILTRLVPALTLVAAKATVAVAVMTALGVFNASTAAATAVASIGSAATKTAGAITLLAKAGKVLLFLFKAIKTVLGGWIGIITAVAGGLYLLNKRFEKQKSMLKQVDGSYVSLEKALDDVTRATSNYKNMSIEEQKVALKGIKIKVSEAKANLALAVARKAVADVAVIESAANVQKYDKLSQNPTYQAFGGDSREQMEAHNQFNDALVNTGKESVKAGVRVKIFADALSVVEDSLYTVTNGTSGIEKSMRVAGSGTIEFAKTTKDLIAQLAIENRELTHTREQLFQLSEGYLAANEDVQKWMLSKFREVEANREAKKASDAAASSNTKAGNAAVASGEKMSDAITKHRVDLEKERLEISANELQLYKYGLEQEKFGKAKKGFDKDIINSLVAKKAENIATREATDIRNEGLDTLKASTDELAKYILFTKTGIVAVDGLKDAENKLHSENIKKLELMQLINDMKDEQHSLNFEVNVQDGNLTEKGQALANDAAVVSALKAKNAQNGITGALADQSVAALELLQSTRRLNDAQTETQDTIRGLNAEYADHRAYMAGNQKDYEIWELTMRGVNKATAEYMVTRRMSMKLEREFADILENEVTAGFKKMVNTGNDLLDTLIAKLFEAMIAGQSLGQIFGSLTGGGGGGGLAGAVLSLFQGGKSAVPTTMASDLSYNLPHLASGGRYYRAGQVRLIPKRLCSLSLQVRVLIF